MSELKWGIISTGNISHAFASALAASEHCELFAVASRTLQSALEFGNAYGLTEDRCYGNYQELLNDPGVQAVYIATPHNTHTEWGLKALVAGKAVLCEKPMGLNHSEVMALTTTARRTRQFLMEAFMYRVHPQTSALLETIRSGEIGRLRYIEAQFGYHARFDPSSRLFDRTLAGGGVMDVGCYPVSFARLMMDTEPERVSASGHLGESGVDEYAAAHLHFGDGRSAQIATAVSLTLDNTATLYGDKGRIHVPHPWQYDRSVSEWAFTVTTDKGTKEVSGRAEHIYAMEADHVAQCLMEDRLESPLMSWADSLGNALVLDKWRAEVGLVFPAEQPESHARHLWHAGSRPLAIQSGEIKHLDKPVARLVMGCDNQPSISHASVMWDDYFSMGGNAFDTAYIYGSGRMEEFLGHWHITRGVRDDIAIIGKGAHTPDNFPAAISPQLDQSLERLQTDYVDIYFLHRDNLEIPVEEFIDALNAEVANGRIRSFGGSNWSLERVISANAYAEKTGQQGFSAVSNNFSLAIMNEPIWPGIRTSTGSDWKAFLTSTDTALMPWSSQARGFFTPWAEEVRRATGSENAVVTTMQPTIAELTRVWFSENNFLRRDRAQELANQYGVELINIALAYVLRQPFPVFALIGPRVMDETESCAKALSIALTAKEIDFLENGNRG